MSVSSDASYLDSDPTTPSKPTSRLWRSLRSSRLLRLRFVLAAFLLALILGLTAAQLEALLTNTPVPAPEVRAQNSSAGCNWTCCRPMTLYVHATGHSIVDPDPNNEPNQVDLVWRRSNVLQQKANFVVPIRFRIKYCQGWGSTNCHFYAGLTQIDPDAPPSIVEDDETGEPWPSVGACGQSLPAPFPSATQIVSLASWVSPNPGNWGQTPCGTSASLDPDACDPFVDSDYVLWIARTVDLQIPGVPTLCFSSMEVWVDDEQADDDTLLVQHVDDLKYLFTVSRQRPT